MIAMTLLQQKTLMKWYKTYKYHNSFQNVKKPSNGWSVLLTLFEVNPDIKEAVIQYSNDNLSVLSGELLHSFITDKCLPTLLETRCTETNNQSMTMSELLQENKLTSFHPRTVNNWIKLLGFKYSERKKTYNDKHKSIENISYCHHFIKRYFKYELFSH